MSKPRTTKKRAAKPDLAWCITCQGITTVVAGDQKIHMKDETKAAKFVAAINALIQRAPCHP